MKAGRELDAMIAKHIFNRKVVDGALEAKGRYKRNNQERLPHYSTYIEDALLIVDKLKLEAWGCTLDTYVTWWNCEFYRLPEEIDNDAIVEHIGTAPLAICLAALKTKGVEA